MAEQLLPTPSHTIGPFYGHALPFPDGDRIAPQGHPDAISLHGYVYDGAGAPVPDALLDFWQAAPDGSLAGTPGSMRRDPSTGGFLGRNGVDFTGYGRVPTDADGHYALHTLPPGNPGLPYISVCVFARGLTHHLFTRAYLADGADPLLDSLPAGRRATLIAAGGTNRAYRFDIRLQGEGETVFLEFR
ncbi:protocatechuate 3,4-dioxygenase alpha subunit [Streptomyces sp. V3I8]|jgi:protocatechuate 3,4-dioxygenase alpha subunit|uniref:protocatechuate 3,4-dioxygenase subunit alpha n=1 Tax=Streptomyces sp. V3I8 TaxID=3042279 RepID=UPI00278B691F|nr:protocatechuate 3,4-dioxygenase subunit alpha [Streptomyces sp. V3I8]MDQ1034945.1 protocatechuate 3,4-dioxygenase alpha subunit [Streptomyces sp. V3I8]